MLCIVKRSVAPALKTRVGFGCTNKPEERYRIIEEAISSSSLLSENTVNVTVSEGININTGSFWMVHDLEYIDYVKNAHASLVRSADSFWTSTDGALVPNHFCRTKPNKSIVPLYKHSGYHCGDTMTPLYEDTYLSATIAAEQARVASVNACKRNAVTNELLHRAAYSLVDSPGHHAKFDQSNGYCFFNNGMIAAEQMREELLGEGGVPSRIAILDLDFHAGNGTEEIMHTSMHTFQNMIAISIHADPRYDYPSFDGLERHSACALHDKDISNRVINIPMPVGTTWLEYQEKLVVALSAIKKFKVDGLVIAFGGDTYKDDPDASPLVRFALEVEDYSKMSRCIVEELDLDIPIVITQEGGYNMEHIGSIVSSFLSGFFPPQFVKREVQ